MYTAAEMFDMAGLERYISMLFTLPLVHVVKLRAHTFGIVGYFF